MLTTKMVLPDEREKALEETRRPPLIEEHCTEGKYEYTWMIDNKGKLQGEYKVAMNNKMKKIATYKDNLLHGKVIKYNKHGIIRSQSEFSEGVLNGEKIKYFKNNTIEYKKRYDLGQLVYEQIYCMELMSNSSLVSIVQYNKHGVIRKIITFANGRVRSVDNYNDSGVRHGPRLMYVDGVLKTRTEYVNGLISDDKDKNKTDELDAIYG